MTKIGIIIGSTRPGRNGEAVARWVHEVASQRTDAEFELVDLLDYKLPHLDEAIPPSFGQYTQPHTRAQLALSLATDFEAYTKFRPNERHEQSLHTGARPGRRLEQRAGAPARARGRLTDVPSSGEVSDCAAEPRCARS